MRILIKKIRAVMKKRLSIFIIMLFILFILIYPADCVKAAANGLILWYENILPALLPFTIFSNILIQSGYLDDLIRAASPVLNHLFFHHPQAAYPVISGFLFGFPMGSKTTADLLREGKLTVPEANILCAMCNNISPVFVSSYLLISSLGIYDKTWLTYAILYLPPLVSGMILLRLTKPVPLKKNKASDSNLNFQIIDAGIMNGFETLLKLGGYIMLFSLLSQMCLRLAGNQEFLCICLTGITEITNGIHVISQSSAIPGFVKYPLLTGLTAFGGLSGFAQTASMVKDTMVKDTGSKNTGISMRFYFVFRLVQTGVSSLLAFWLL